MNLEGSKNLDKVSQISNENANQNHRIPKVELSALPKNIPFTYENFFFLKKKFRIFFN